MRPYRYDIVGSFLRPDYLKDARAEYAEGTLSADQLREVEDKAIKELVEKELIPKSVIFSMFFYVPCKENCRHTFIQLVRI